MFFYPPLNRAQGWVLQISKFWYRNSYRPCSKIFFLVFKDKLKFRVFGWKPD